jgi:hypothetical protein
MVHTGKAMTHSTTKAVQRGKLSFRYSPHRVDYSGWISDPSPVEVVTPEIVNGRNARQLERGEVVPEQVAASDE